MFIRVARFFLDKPIKIKLLISFLPIVIVSVTLTGLFSYLFAAKQLRENASYLLYNNVYQITNTLNEKLTGIFEQLIIIENSPGIQNTIFDIYHSKTQEENYQNYLEINNRLNDIYQTHFQILDSIYINFDEVREYKLFREPIPAQTGIKLKDWVEKYNWSDKGYYWLNNHNDVIYQTPDERMVISMFKIIGNINSRVKGIMLFNLRSQSLLKILSNIQISPNGYMILISDDGHVLSKDIHYEDGIGEKGFAFLRKNSGNNGSFNVTGVGGEEMFVVFNTISINKWVIAAVIPEKDILRDAEKIKVITFAIIIALIGVSIILAVIIAGSISTSIRYLSNQVRLFERGDFNVTFDVRDQDSEIGILATGLSSLLKTVKNLLQEIREEQMKKRQIELLALQSQINPHFLYNTLGSIRHLIDMEENKDASKMLGALTKYFMIGISKGKEIITIKEEIEHVHNYLLIQKMRYSTAFDFEFDIDAEILNCHIIKLTLQPIVENAIYHGIKNKHGNGIIKIKGSRQKNNIMMEIYDDGAGMDEDKLNRVRSAILEPGISENPVTFGMKNVNERIKLHFGSDYGIEVDSEKDQYTIVKIMIPFIDTHTTS